MFSLFRRRLLLPLFNREKEAWSGSGITTAEICDTRGSSDTEWFLIYLCCHLGFCETDSEKDTTASCSLQLQRSPARDLFLADIVPTTQDSLTVFDGLDLGFPQYSSMLSPRSEQYVFQGYNLSQCQERDMLVHFFDEVHYAIPLFERARFLQLYDSGIACRDLVVTMATIAAKILGPVTFWTSADIDLCMSTLLKLTTSDDDSSSTSTNLDQLRRNCLLAYYDFHQFPESSAWMRISKLIRKAHSMGLNQIENPELCSAFDPELVTEDEMEDWRCIWWCIYCLDSYSNISSGTPYIVDIESINTALIRRPLNGAVAMSTNCQPKVFLPDDPGQLWKTTQAIISNDQQVGFNIHMVTTTVLRQAGNILRLRSERGPGYLQDRIAALKANLASLRLALPSRYLNPARNVLTAETNADHHTRLTNVLHLHMAQLIVSLPGKLSANETDWMDQWQQTLEAAQDIVLIVERWNSHFSPRVDPAICFIVFTALMSVILHQRCITGAAPEVQASLTQSENTLLLFLEQFSNMWGLPKFLTQVFKHHQATMATGPLTCVEVDQILRNIRLPLHPKVLSSIRKASGHDAQELSENFDLNLDLDLWNFENLSAVTSQ